jgi:YbbR domain-containing protein
LQLWNNNRKSKIESRKFNMAFNFDNEINRLLRLPRDVKGWLSEIFLKDWGLKLIALVITLAFWFGVTGQRAPVTVPLRGVRLTFRLPPDTDISNEYRNEIEITVTGDKSDVDRLKDRLVATVDVSSYQPGERQIQLTPTRIQMDLPAGVKIEDVRPNSVMLRLEPRLERELEVEPHFLGKLPEGYEQRDVIIAPQKIKVRGPASHINALEKAPTERIPLEGLKADKTFTQVAIDIKDEKVSIVDSGVTVSLKIGEQRIEKSFDGVTVRVSSGETARPEKASVTLFGDKSVIEALRSGDIQIFLDVASDGAITPRMVLPQNLQNRIELRSTKPSGFSIEK